MNAFLLSAIFCIFICGVQNKAVQERAMVNYFDPKYVKKATAFTFRARRGDPYRSNLTATTLHAWGNNVTFSVSYASKRTGNDLILNLKSCDFLSLPWLEDFIWAHFHTKKCPFPAGTYSVNNLELPPKNYPFPVPKGEGQLVAYFSLTGNKQVILKFSMKLKHS